MARICVFCETWESGGIEAFLCNAICHMDLAGLEIDIVAARLGESIFTPALKERGVRFLPLSGSTRKLAENHRRFSALLAQQQYDVVHLNAYQALSLCYLALAQKAGVPVRIAHSHNTELRKSPGRPLKLALHRWARRAYGDVMTHRWACSASAARFLFGDTPEWTFVPNGIDVERFRFAPAARARVRGELGLEGKLVIGNVGRLCYQKNQDFLLEVFQTLQRQCPESALLLVGEGEDRPALREKAKKLGLEKAAIFYGLSGHVEELFWAMDVFVMPSRFEGLPVTAVEAQCAGLPCLFADTLTREVRLGEAVRYLPLTAPAGEWAEALLTAEVRRDRATGAEAVREAGFDISGVSRRIKEFYLKGGEG